MKLKSLILVIFVLAALSAVVYFIKRPRPIVNTDPRIGASLVDQAILEKTAHIKFSDNGRNIELKKNANGSWRVVSYHDFPANFAKISAFVSDLLNAKIESFVTDRTDLAAGLEFKERSIVLLDSAGKELLVLAFGKNAEGGGRMMHFGNERKIYLCIPNPPIYPDQIEWVDTQLVDLRNDDVAQIEVAFKDAPSIVARRAKKEDPFTSENAPAGQRIKNDSIMSLLSSLTTLRFTDTTKNDDPEVDAARKHQRSIKLTSFDGKTLVIAFGRRPEEVITWMPEQPRTPAKDEHATTVAKAGETTPAASPESTSAEAQKPTEPTPAKKIEPVTETIPEGLAYAFVTSSDKEAVVNEMMSKRACQIDGAVFSSLPKNAAELFEPQPESPAPPAEKKP